MRGRAAATYNAAADSYDAPANTFWQRYGARTVERLNLRQGMRVLDVCAGSGASALPAADAVGPSGHVIAVDAAQSLLTLLRRKAEARGLHHLHVCAGDLLALGVAESSFDAVVCVFGIFFVSDMERAVAELWRRVRPGGQLAVTTWGPQLFEPMNSPFWDAIAAERPDLYKAFSPWDALTHPEALAQLLRAGGVPAPRVEAESGVHPLATPDDWWTLVMGSGYRGTVDRLTPEERARVRMRNQDYFQSASVQSVHTNVVYATAVKDRTDAERG
jgi:SAM-dependent methyltransferase